MRRCQETLVFENISHCVVWCLKEFKEKEMAKQQKKGVADTTQIVWRLVGGAPTVTTSRL